MPVRLRRNRLATLGCAALIAGGAALPLAVTPSVAAASSGPAIVSEGVTNVGLDGLTFTATVDLSGQSGLSLCLQYGTEIVNGQYEVYGDQGAGDEGPPPPTDGPSGCQQLSSANGNVQTVSFPVPYAFDTGFYNRWPCFPDCVGNQIINHSLQPWKRTQPTVTLHYRFNLGPGVDIGPDQTVSSPTPAAAATVTTGAAYQKGLQVFFPVTFDDQGQGYTFLAQEWGTSPTALDHGYIPRMYGPTITSSGTFYTPSSTQVHQLTYPSDAPRTEPPGTTIYYRWVADNGFGSAPAYGQELSFTLPGGSPAKALAQALKLTAAQTSIHNLLSHGGVNVAAAAPGPGRESIVWRAKSTLVASGSKSFSKAGKATLAVRLTGAGRKLLAKSQHLKLSATGTFKPKSGKTTTAHSTITLHH